MYNTAKNSQIRNTLAVNSSNEANWLKTSKAIDEISPVKSFPGCNGMCGIDGHNNIIPKKQDCLQQLYLI